MNIHKNAALTPKSRGDVARCIAEGGSRAEVAKTFCICAKTAAKWAKRFQNGGGVPYVIPAALRRRPYNDDGGR